MVGIICCHILVEKLSTDTSQQNRAQRERERERLIFSVLSAVSGWRRERDELANRQADKGARGWITKWH